MSQRKIKRDAFRAFQLRKKHTQEVLRNPHPIATVLMVDGEIRAVGMNRERLAQWAAEQSIESFEMFDYVVVV